MAGIDTEKKMAFRYNGYDDARLRDGFTEPTQASMILDARGWVFLWAFLVSEAPIAVSKLVETVAKEILERSEATQIYFPADAARWERALVTWAKPRIEASDVGILSLVVRKPTWPDPDAERRVDFGMDGFGVVRCRGVGVEFEKFVRDPKSVDDARVLAKELLKQALEALMKGNDPRTELPEKKPGE